MSKKIKVKASKFLNWYFSDLDELLEFGREMVSELQSEGYVKETVQGILDRCGYIPGYITENPDDENEYDPSEIELVLEKKPEYCNNCGYEYDHSMDNFCNNCLALK